MSLSHNQIKNARPQPKPYKLYDRDGLYLIVRSNGKKSWKYDYKLNGKRKTYTLGSYPELSLADARLELQGVKRSLSSGTDLTAAKHARRQLEQSETPLFSVFSNDWLEKQALASNTRYDTQIRLKKYIYAALDRVPVDQITTRILYDLLLPLAQKGRVETAKRIANYLKRIFNDLFLLGHIERNPALGLSEVLPKKERGTQKNFAHLTNPEDFKLLLSATYAPHPRIHPSVILALKLMPLVFLRPANIRHLRWNQVDFNERRINFTAAEMKGRKEHFVPLADQAVRILLEAQRTQVRSSPYVFTTSHGNGRPMSENTTTVAITRLTNPSTGKPFGRGFMTSHGFRHTASTLLNELGYDPDAVELQLAHQSKDRVRATYNKALLANKRRLMMQEWANYLDKLRVGTPDTRP